MAFVWSLNAARRHLNASQEAMARARALPLFQAEAKVRQVRKPSDSVVENVPPQKARDAAAAGSAVSGRTIQHAATVLAHGTPDLVRAVERGKLAVSAAAELARLPVATQAGVLARADTAEPAPAVTPSSRGRRQGRATSLLPRGESRVREG